MGWLDILYKLYVLKMKSFYFQSSLIEDLGLPW